MTRHHVLELLFVCINLPKQNPTKWVVLTEGIVRNGNEQAIVVGDESCSVSQENRTAGVT